jgi:hypothetical protein
MHIMTKGTLAAVAALVLVGPAIAQGTGGRPLGASLTGAEEPAGGDADGFGTFEAQVNPGQGRVCYRLTATDIAPATAAHIHIGDPGVAGPVVVPLTAPTGGVSSGCVSIARELAMELIQNPGEYYVNVHNAEFPAGAIRGQLG